MTERNVSVTLKAGKGYDAPWLTVTGDNAEEARRTLAEAVNLDLEVADRYSLAEVTVFASQAFQGTSNVVADLGAAPLDPPAAEEAPASGSEDGDGWAKAKAKRASKPRAARSKAQETPSEATSAPEADEDPILVAIRQAPDGDALRRIWARHKKAWADEHSAAVAARKEELG